MMACDVCVAGASTLIFEVLSLPVAETAIVGEELWLNSFYDDRTYDESHPAAAFQHNVGGWQVGISVFDTDLANNISRVEIITSGVTTVIAEPDVYGWLGKTMRDYVIFTGVKHWVKDQYEIFIYDHADQIIPFIFAQDPSQEMHNSVFLETGKDNALPPKCKIKNMAIKEKTGQVKMRFTAPADPNVNHIRIRLFDADGNGVFEQRIKPDEDGGVDDSVFEIVKKDGTSIPERVKVFLDSEWAGHLGRIEYRTIGTDGEGYDYTLRGITYFKLPDPLTPPVPLARCFTFNGTIYNRVNSMGPAWDGSTLFAQVGLNIDTPVSYQICTNEDGGFTAELKSFPVAGGVALSDIGNPSPEMFNTGHYEDPIDDSDVGWLLVGTPSEYVQVVFGETPPQAWAIGDTFEIIHSIHQPHNDPNSPWGPDGYSRIRNMGTITSIDPVVE